MSDIEDIMVQHIKNKNDNASGGKWSSGVYKEARTVSGTDIGDAGEKFIRDLFVKYGYLASQGGHDEYDLLVVSPNANSIKIEIKTAKEGRENETYQFDGIDPRHNARYTILLGISNNNLYFNFFTKEDIRWNHAQKYYYVQGIRKTTGEKRLVRMSPNNEFNLKLTLQRSSLFLMTDLNIEAFLRNIAEEQTIDTIIEP